MDLLVLGPVEVASDGERLPVGGPKQRSVLAQLVANAGRVVPVDRIVDDVYGDSADAGARRSIQTFISSFRQELGEVIHWRGDGYVLDVDPTCIDAACFEQLATEARKLIAVDPVKASAALREALALWRGHPYADVDGRGALAPEITRLSELRLSALEWRIDADLAAGRHSQLVGELEALADEFPFRERFRAQHMLALYRSGRQAEALRAFERTKQGLLEELGLEPSQELQDLELRILQQDDELLIGAGRAVTQRLAFLVTDIEGSTKRWDRQPAEMADALAAHDRLLGEAIEAAGGSVFKHTGDGLMAAFPAVADAVVAAESALRALRDHEWGDAGELRVSAGIDVGEVEARANDFFGPPVNRAARLTAAAHGGQVLVSSAAQSELLEDAPAGVQLRPLGEFPLRGFAAGERIGQLVFVGLPADFPDLRLDADALTESGPSMVALPGYELREVVGEGATGFVFRGYQPSVGREVAIKVIRPEFAGRPSFVRRFEAEARTIGRLAHPRIVPLHDFWRDADGAYLVMQLLRGGSLTPLLGSLDLASAVRIVRHVGEGLSHAHEMGVVHGDVKPGNVLLDGDGNAYLSDFGISTRLFDRSERVGTSSAPAYRAPEEQDGGPSLAADQFALGMLAYETITGRTPVMGESLRPASAHVPGLPVEVDQVLAQATAFDSGDRYESIAQFLAAFDASLGDAWEAPVPVLTAVRNPFKGLRAFDEADAHDFHGREELIRSLLSAVERLRFVTLVGPSGCGKSSAVRAGLLPALRQGRIPGSADWFTASFAPGSDPHRSLADALESVATTPVDVTGLIEDGDLTGAVERSLATVDGDLLLIIDQFEEVFTLVESAERRSDFLHLLQAAVTVPDTRVRIVTTLRADFYDRPLQHDGLDRLVRDGLVTVLRPNPDELGDMITKPAHAVGLRWEPGLPARIANEVHGQPGGLPLLQYALTELVERRDTDLLTADDYSRIGGISGALASRAEAVFQELAPDQQDTAREVLLRLVTVNEDADDTRRRVRRSELDSLAIDPTDLDSVLSAFTARRLLTTDRDPVTHGPTLEVAHEALLHQWPRLRDWIEGQRESLVLGRRLRAAMADWEDAGRDDDFLLTGHRLAPFAAWAPTTTLTDPERGFFDSSIARDTAEANARARRRRVLTTILAVASVVALILATAAAIQWQRAEESARQARARELASASLNELGTDPERSILLALEAMEAAGNNLDTLEPVNALRSSLAASRVAGRFDAGKQVDYSSNGLWLAGVYNDEASVWDAPSGELIRVFPSPEGRTAYGVSFGPADDFIAVSYDPLGQDVSGPPGPLAAVFEVDSGTLIRTFDGPATTFSSAVVSPDGSSLAAHVYLAEPRLELGEVFGRVEVWVWDIGSGDLRYRIDYGESHSAFGQSFNPSGTIIAVTDENWDVVQPSRIALFDAENGSELDSLETGDWRPIFTQFDPSGRYLAAISQNPEALLIWDVETRERLREIRLGGAQVALEWSPAGDVIAVSGNEGIVRLIDAETGDEVLALTGQDSNVWGLSFSPDGGFVAGAGLQSGTLVWDVADAFSVEVSTIDTPFTKFFPHGVRYSQDGESLLVFTDNAGDSVLARIDAAQGTLEASVEGQYNVWPVVPVLEPAAGLVASTGADGAVSLYDSHTLARVGAMPEGVIPFAISQDGTRAVIGESQSSYDVVVDTASWTPIRELDGTQVSHADFSPDGSLISYYSGSAGDQGVMNVETGALLLSGFEFEAADGEFWIPEHFSPDGSLLAADTLTGRVGLLDVEALLSGASPEEALVLDISAHNGPIPRIWFSSDSSLFASWGYIDRHLRVWSAEDGNLVADIATDADYPGVDFHPNGKHIIVEGPNGTLRVHTLEQEELIEIAQSRLTRTFTADECATYRIDPCPSLEDLKG